MRQIATIALMLILSFSLAAPLTAQDSETPLTVFLEANHAVPCQEAPSFSCVTLAVPLNHFDKASSATIDVVFAALPAANPLARRGMFITAVGGPGTSGLHVAEIYTPAYAALTERFDIVFFDQRGIGRSEGIRCDDDAVAFYSNYYASDDYVSDAQTFVTNCIETIDRADLLPYLSTAQAIEDLEIFRREVGDQQLWLYGESYGTQYAQTYAQRYPQHIAGLVLDGVIDLTLTAEAFYRGQNQAFDDTLDAALDACAADPICAADFPSGDPHRAYDRLDRALYQGTIGVEFPLPDGTREKRELTYDMLDAAFSDGMYSETGRAMFLRELAAAANGMYLPLMRHGYRALGMDSSTETALYDPSFSQASYFAIECSDYHFDLVGGDPVCYYWNEATGAGTLTRPPPLTVNVPTLVLNATLDPATPIRNGQDVASRLPNAYTITMQGGPHVIFGRGRACPDDLVTAFLLEGSTPPQRETICEGRVYGLYFPLADPDTDDPLEVMLAFDRMRDLLPEYLFWNTESALIIGCDYGGTYQVLPTSTGEIWLLDRCAMLPNIAVTGEGELHWEHERLTLSVTIEGDVNGALTYIREALWATREDNFPVRIQGVWNGEEVTLEGD